MAMDKVTPKRAGVDDHGNVYYRALDEHIYNVLMVWAKKVLAENGWGQNEWARRAGISQGALSRMLNPVVTDVPNLRTIVLLGEVAGCLPNFLRCGTRTNVRSKRYMRSSALKTERNAHKRSPQAKPA